MNPRASLLLAPRFPCAPHPHSLRRSIGAVMEVRDG